MKFSIKMSLEQLDNYMIKLAVNKKLPYHERSLLKWKQLIEWTEANNVAPDYIATRRCGLCNTPTGKKWFDREETFIGDDCDGCPLKTDCECYRRSDFVYMDNNNTDPKKWIKNAKHFYAWMQKRLENYKPK